MEMLRILIIVYKPHLLAPLHILFFFYQLFLWDHSNLLAGHFADVSEVSACAAVHAVVGHRTPGTVQWALQALICKVKLGGPFRP